MIKKKLLITFGILFLVTACKEDKETEVLFTGGLTTKKLELDASQVSRGEKIFNQQCVACHQSGGLGKAGLAPRINSPEFLGLANDGFIRKTILDGRAGTSMMGFSAIPQVKDSIDDLVVYIRSWQNDYVTFKSYSVDGNVKIKGNTKDGKKLFVNYCASCHGDSGKGYSAGGSGPGIGLKSFLSVASDEYIKKTIELGRAGTAMKSFSQAKGLAHLTDGQINNIVSYLRHLE